LLEPGPERIGTVSAERTSDVKEVSVARRPSTVLLWDAVRFALSDDPVDMADVAAYVTSRGHRAVEQFWTELAEQRSKLRDAGVVEAMRRGGVTNTGVRVAELTVAEVDRCLDGLILEGRDFVHELVEDCSLVEEDPLLLFPDLTRAFVRAADDQRVLDGPLWEVKRGDLRRDGEPWLEVTAVREDVTDGVSPVLSDGFHEQFQQLGTQAAFSEPWRRLRDSLGVRTLDVLVDYGSLFSDEPFEVERRRRTLDVTVQRRAAELVNRGGDPTGAVARGARREAGEVLRIVHAKLAEGLSATR